MTVRLSAFLVLAAVVACSKPHDTTIPSDPASWETTLKPAIEKLPQDEREALGRYLLRMKMAEAFKKGGMPPGTTIGAALAAQKTFDDEQKKQAEEQRLLKEKLELETAEFERQINAILTAALISKQLTKREWQEQISLELGFQNKGTKDIAGFKGYTVFNDMFGDKIINVTLSYDDPIKAGETVRWAGAVDYNQFKDEHRKLVATDTAKIQFKFVPTMIIFADGTKMQAPGE
jgi:hypothetical protein